jgi:hypothetical protein
MDTLLRDLRFSLRSLRKDRAALGLALLALALGVGSTTAMFSVIDNVLLEPWPYQDGNSLSVIQIHDSSSNEPYGRTFFSQPEFVDMQKAFIFSGTRSLRAAIECSGRMEVSRNRYSRASSVETHSRC